MSPRARIAKNKARLSAYDKLAAQEFDEREDSIDLQIPPGPRLGSHVLKAQNIRKAFGDNVLIDDLSFELPPAGLVGVIGPNGAGKTTLFKLITGAEKPDAGTLNIGETVVVSYVDQNRETLDPEKSVYEEVSDGDEFLQVGKVRLHARAYLSRFNFRGPDQQKKVGNLSGGERNRIQLAKLLRRGGNLLLLDEPTNDLDVDTLRTLEEALMNFPGCAMVVSHDRYFLDRIATHILAFEGEGKVRWFEGNFQAYEERRKEELGDAYQPHRIKYKKLTAT
jgi:ATPase subunit of ABC transporter with duplicated ATPase domains